MSEKLWLVAALKALGFTTHSEYPDPSGALIYELTRGPERVCIASRSGTIEQVLIASADGPCTDITPAALGIQKAALSAGSAPAIDKGD